eukprot:CAMPEP_0195060888 /NCGR_PEP_ID=MMETSP0448-20130528/8047_1 /TAXON_ID=66468 /ORGANISM="Heterocapsa triquestra, Strain CCMP 448" /LENGTH=159 /DNA_ID=CAMNT_0040091389 /DNA_START=6 /DNA_END=485 /DNA_ORIENTATION=+
MTRLASCRDDGWGQAFNGHEKESECMDNHSTCSTGVPSGVRSRSSSGFPDAAFNVEDGVFLRLTEQNLRFHDLRLAEREDEEEDVAYLLNTLLHTHEECMAAKAVQAAKRDRQGVPESGTSHARPRPMSTCSVTNMCKSMPWVVVCNVLIIATAMSVMM